MLTDVQGNLTYGETYEQVFDRLSESIGSVVKWRNNTYRDVSIISVSHNIKENLTTDMPKRYVGSFIIVMECKN